MALNILETIANTHLYKDEPLIIDLNLLKRYCPAPVKYDRRRCAL